MTDENQFPLPKPPGLLGRGAPWPTADPPLVDQDPPDGREDIERLEPFESTPLEDELTREEGDRARQIALEEPRVRELLGGDRVTDFGAALVKGKDEGQPDLLRYQFFSCDTLRSVQIVFGRSTLAVLEVTSAEGQPAPLPEEVDRAISLAAAELAVDRGLIGQAIFITREDPNDPLFRHRLADVRFGKPEERRPRLRALVDLCDERVVDSGEFRGAS
jgi:hypothetical protein